jgi:hypothetical protein
MPAAQSQWYAKLWTEGLMLGIDPRVLFAYSVMVSVYDFDLRVQGL